MTKKMKPLLLLSFIVMISCYNPQTQTLKEEDIKDKQITSEHRATRLSEDTIYTNIEDIYSTAELKSHKVYFSTNNRYKDWDKNDERIVIVGYVSEKDSTTSHVEIRKSCGINKLDEEALRLVEGIKFDEPSKNAKGEPIRAAGMAIPVYFPPKKIY